jgi:hypothetical protein
VHNQGIQEMQGFCGRKCRLTGVISKLSGILFYIVEENNAALNVV